MDQNSSLSEIGDDLKCPICLDLYSHPVILPCSHVICRQPCAERLFNTSSLIRCPVCRDGSYVSGGLENLPRVISLENIIERYRAQTEPEENSEEIEEPPEANPDSIPCQLCDSPHVKAAHKSCIDCNASYCSACLQKTHPNRKPFNEHHLVAPCSNPRPKDVTCHQHGEKMIKFCLSCNVLLCNVCDQLGYHSQHWVNLIEVSNVLLKGVVEKNVSQLNGGQKLLAGAIRTLDEHLILFQGQVSTRQAQINSNCDSLVEEVEAKRRVFLSDLEFEKNSKTVIVESKRRELEKQSQDAVSLSQYASEVIKEVDPMSFLQLGGVVNERLIKVNKDLDETTVNQEIELIRLDNKQVDLRKYRDVIREMYYLAVPAIPLLDEKNCFCCADKVILVLCPPSNSFEIVDQYIVSVLQDGYSELKVHHIFTTESISSNSKNGHQLSVLVIDNLQPSTKYGCCVLAVNRAGQSPESEVVTFETLAPGQSSLSMPKIEENMCRTFTTSIIIFCSSPEQLTSNKENYLILYRPRNETHGHVWKSKKLFGRSNHPVFGLEHSKEYEFIVIATSESREAQVSNMVVQKTEYSRSTQSATPVPGARADETSPRDLSGEAVY